MLYRTRHAWTVSALAALCFLFWPAGITTGQTSPGEPKYRELPNFHRVNDRLYRGAQPRAGGLEKLAALGINTIINLRADDQRATDEKNAAEAAGLRYFNFPLSRSGRPSRTDIQRILATIEDPQNGTVFVHCAQGEDRTGVVIAAYRIRRDGWTSAQAKAEANRYGMKIWQRGKKDFIHDYYRDLARGSTR